MGRKLVVDLSSSSPIVHGLGLLLILGAAMPHVRTERDLEDNFCGPNERPTAPTFATTYLQYAHSLVQECRDPQGIVNRKDDDDEEEEDLSEAERSIAPHPSAPDSPESSATILPAEYRPSLTNNCCLLEDVKIGCSVAQFCTLKDLRALRGVSRGAKLAADEFAQFDGVSRMIFLPLPLSVTSNLSLTATSRSASGGRRYAAESTNSPASNRLFVGQLRKESTVASVAWLTGMLCSSSAQLLRIDAHTNVDGRGKGCAWVYPADRASMHELLVLHKRVYFDFDGIGEGVWLCNDGQTNVLESYAAEQHKWQRHTYRPTVLPRQPLVVEEPIQTAISTHMRHRSSVGPRHSALRAPLPAPHHAHPIHATPSNYSLMEEHFYGSESAATTASYYYPVMTEANGTSPPHNYCHCYTHNPYAYPVVCQDGLSESES